MLGLSTPKISHSGFFFFWETRLKLAGMMGLAFSIAAISELKLMPFIIATTLLIMIVSRLPFSYLLSRLKFPGVFLFAMAVFLPLFSGTTVLAEIGPFSLKKEGIIMMLTIALKLISIVTIIVVLFASSEVSQIIKSMRYFRFPPMLTDMFFLTYRYIHQLYSDIHRARNAARLRGANFKSTRSLKTNSYIVGTLLVKSHDQAERIFNSMILRGYGNNEAVLIMKNPCAKDFLVFGMFAVTSLALAAAQILVF